MVVGQVLRRTEGEHDVGTAGLSAPQTQSAAGGRRRPACNVQAQTGGTVAAGAAREHARIGGKSRAVVMHAQGRAAARA